MTVILHSNLETDLRLAATLDRSIHALLTDMASIRRTGAVPFMGLVNDTGSDTKRVRFAGLDGYDAMSTTAAENTDVSTTALTDASADIAVVRGALRYDESDLAELTGFGGSDINPVRLAQSMVGAFEKWFNSLVADVIDDFGTDVGTSTVDMSVDDFMDAIYTLEIADVPGPFFAMLHARQLADFQNSLRSESGVLQWQAASAEMLKIKGQGYAGNYLGVDIYRNSQVNSAGGNRHGAMWGLGAIGHCLGVPNPRVIGQGQVIRFGDAPVLVEFQRDSSAATTETIGHGYAGVSIMEDSRGVGIVTDA